MIGGEILRGAGGVTVTTAVAWDPEESVTLTVAEPAVGEEKDPLPSIEPTPLTTS